MSCNPVLTSGKFPDCLETISLLPFAALHSSLHFSLCDVPFLPAASIPHNYGKNNLLFLPPYTYRLPVPHLLEQAHKNVPDVFLQNTFRENSQMENDRQK